MREEVQKKYEKAHKDWLDLTTNQAREKKELLRLQKSEEMKSEKIEKLEEMLSEKNTAAGVEGGAVAVAEPTQAHDRDASRLSTNSNSHTNTSALLNLNDSVNAGRQSQSQQSDVQKKLEFAQM